MSTNRVYYSVILEESEVSVMHERNFKLSDILTPLKSSVWPSYTFYYFVEDKGTNKKINSLKYTYLEENENMRIKWVENKWFIF